MSFLSAKQSRIELRVNPEDKQTLEAAAALKGLSLSAYLLSLGLDAARAEIAMHERLVLSNNDRDLFLAALDAPPHPSAAMLSAAQRFQAKYGNSER